MFSSYKEEGDRKCFLAMAPLSRPAVFALLLLIGAAAAVAAYEDYDSYSPAADEEYDDVAAYDGDNEAFEPAAYEEDEQEEGPGYDVLEGESRGAFEEAEMADDVSADVADVAPARALKSKGGSSSKSRKSKSSSKGHKSKSSKKSHGKSSGLGAHMRQHSKNAREKIRNVNGDDFKRAGNMFGSFSKGIAGGLLNSGGEFDERSKSTLGDKWRRGKAKVRGYPRAKLQQIARKSRNANRARNGHAEPEE